MNRQDAVDDLYKLLDQARTMIGGFQQLRNSGSRSAIPTQGVYFFFDESEPRAEVPGVRIVRVGTHAVSTGSKQVLVKRLRQHRGTTRGLNPGGGNHRGSIFRRHVGAALIERDGWADAAATWGDDLPAGDRPSTAEGELERAVSDYVCSLPYIWVPVPGEAGPTSDRATIERGAIALLSNRGRDPIDPPSDHWLGRQARDARIRESGLWNVRHVDEPWSESVIAAIRGHLLG